MSRAAAHWSRQDAEAFARRTGNKAVAEALGRPGLCVRSPALAVSGGPGDKTAGKPVRGKKRREMNSTERGFSMLLEARRLQKEIVSWEFESVMFRWGERDTLKYSPDFTVIVETLLPGEDNYPFVRLVFIETYGGFKRPGDLRRFKEARNRFLMFEFQLWERTKEEGWKQIL